MKLDLKSTFIYIPIVATILGLLYTGITTFNDTIQSIERATKDIELIRKDLSYWEGEMNRTKEDFAREMTRIVTEIAEARAYIDTSRENGYTIQNTVSQNTYDIKELTRQLNGGW
jgi:hypothetical protein